ncbi:hydroxypyruvate isomerase family protein [Haloglycomyces albus]|uniref:hydroxypyruvate isomerase family protein n=1 Tax=Haloglycomyces albus TaxID=526067 RepID=UPI00046D8425|nr:TIM barrel protein [Haloglycomyces albus]
MINYTVNCSILFQELPLLERPAAAKAAGFEGVEFWWPLSESVPGDAEVDRFVRAVENAGVQLTGLNFADDIPNGYRGLLSNPARSREFRDNIDVTVGIAERLGCTSLNALYGIRLDGVAEAEQDELAVVNYGHAATAADRIGATVLVEALNAIESPTFPIVSSHDVATVIDTVTKETGQRNLEILADFYHLARMGEKTSDVLSRYGDRIGHVQIADTPGRNEPGTGDFDFDELYSGLDELGYDGWVGLEYKASGSTVDSFAWRE